MFRSKILNRAMLVVGTVIATYTILLLIVVLPIIEDSTTYLEEKNGRDILEGVVHFTNSMQEDLKHFEKAALAYHEAELKDLTNIFVSIALNAYKQTTLENIAENLRKQGIELERRWQAFYSQHGSDPDDRVNGALADFIHLTGEMNGNTMFLCRDRTLVAMPSIIDEDKASEKNSSKKSVLAELCSRTDTGLTVTDSPAVPIISYTFAIKPDGLRLGLLAPVEQIRKKAKDKILNLARNIRYGKGNYFFIADYNSKVLAHPYIETGTDFSQKRDARGNLIAPPMINVARKQGEGFTRYWWKRGPGSDQILEKLSFCKDFPQWKMVIGTGMFIDDIRKEIGKKREELISQLRSIMASARIGENGYIFIFDEEGKMIIHPDPHLQGMNIREIINPSTGNIIFDDFVQAARTNGVLRYKWDHPDDRGHYVHDKIAWIKHLPDIHWYIVASAYTSEFMATSSHLKKSLFMIGAFVLFVSSLFSFFFFRRLLHPVSELSRLADKVAGGDYSARSNYNANDEIGTLARDFNTMVDTIEDNIKNLDRKVSEKTRELQEQKLVF